jgi:hypothetical protein
MTKRDDPLAGSEATDRVCYALGVLLDADDLLAEQTYHRGRLARALSYLHGSGTAAGLFVTHKSIPVEDVTQPPNGEIEVDAGLAVDALGRLIEIPAKACIRVEKWYDSLDPKALKDSLRAAPHPSVAHGIVADLFVRFRACERGKTPAFVSGPFDATDAIAPSRIRDGYELSLALRIEQPLPNIPANDWSALTPITDLNDATAKAARLTALRKAIFEAWDGGRNRVIDMLQKDQFIPQALRWNAEKEQLDPDPAWVLLARVVIGTDNPGPGATPKRTGTVEVDNDIRPFSVTAGALARWLGF